MLTLPPQLLEILNEWIKNYDEQREIVLQEIEKVEQSLKFEDLELHLIEKSSLDRKEVIMLIQSIVGLFLNYYDSDQSIEEFIEEIIKDETIKSGIDDEKKIKSFLMRILKLEATLGMMSKAIDIMQDHDCVYRNSRIFTDLRHIFSKDIKESPKNAIIIHTLKFITTKGGDIKEIYIAMDSNDLIQLKKVIERAINKEQSLKSLCTKNKIRILEVR
ncbi:MAG: hypothetical protein ACTSPY_18080 [Candidatus Helarchaeota archaeon]